MFALPCIVGGAFCTTGVETVRFWFAAGITARVEAGTPGLGGLGGGIFSGGGPDFSIVTLCGLVGSVGRGSPVTSGVSWPLADPSISSSRSLLLLAIDGCSGGGSNPTCRVLAVATGSLGGRGLRGNVGGDPSSTLAEPLVGGLLKGDTLSGRFLLASIALSAVQEFLDLMSAFPERLGGGGTGSASRCRRSSADRRGGGGEGGLKATTFGDFRGSRFGVRERLGILKFFPGTAGEVAGFTTSSEFRKLGWSFTAMFRDRPLGGDCGGSTVRAGAGTGRGVSGGGGNALRAGEHGRPFSFGRGGARPGLFLGMGGGSLEIAFVSRGLSGRGPGEAFRLEV